MLKGANSSKVIKNVKDRIAQIQKTLPEGVVVEPFLDRTKMVNNAIGTVEKNLVEGALIVVFVLVLFLGNLRAGLVVASVIPLSMLFAIILMNVFGVSGNLMSLGAIDFGLIVDGAVTGAALLGGREAGDIEAGFQSEARSHGRILSAGERRCIVARGPHEGFAGLRNREAQGMANLARGDLVIAEQARENRQTGRIGRSPTGWTEIIQQEIEDRTGISLPARTLRKCPVKLVENAVVGIDGDGVAIAVARAAALNGRSQRHRVRTCIAFVPIQKCCRILGLGSGHSDEWNADGPAIPNACSEVSVHGARRADRVDVGGGVRGYR